MSVLTFLFALIFKELLLFRFPINGYATIWIGIIPISTRKSVLPMRYQDISYLNTYHAQPLHYQCSTNASALAFNNIRYNFEFLNSTPFLYLYALILIGCILKPSMQWSMLFLVKSWCLNEHCLSLEAFYILKYHYQLLHDLFKH